MFGLFTKKLTEYSNHYIDWSRAAELIQAGNHRYSKDELLARGSIVAITAVSAYLGAEANNPEKTNCSATTMAIILGVLAAVISHHFIAVLPLYRKRLEMSRECQQIIDEINQKLEKNEVNMSEACKVHIRREIDTIMHLSLSDEKHGNASQTWGRRKRLLSELNEKLTLEKLNEEDWVGTYARDVSCKFIK
jgi:hypothetical protein